MIGDRERCLQAGMDDHITSTWLFDMLLSDAHRPVEPLRRNDLINAINKLVTARKQQTIINTRRFLDYVDYGRLIE